jgi:hypothetical protein
MLSPGPRRKKFGLQRAPVKAAQRNPGIGAKKSRREAGFFD